VSRRIVCDSPELALECLHRARAIGLDVETEASTKWVQDARTRLQSDDVAVCVAHSLDLEALVELAHAAGYGQRALTLCRIGTEARQKSLLPVARDLGIVAVDEVGALIAALQLAAIDADQPWLATTRALAASDRQRLELAMEPGARSGGQLVPADDHCVAWTRTGGDEPHTLGHARDAAEAIVALRATDRSAPQVVSSVDDVDADAVIDVLLGPRRALSDPASKSALAPYGIPLPEEELCASASRAAAEAARIGFPVRIALASPALRVWDHPDLCVDMVDHAARVRDTFRDLMTLAQTRLPDGRTERDVLGVVVAATGDATALLGVRAWPLPHGKVAMDIAFADPHGRAADDSTLAVLPAPRPAIERMLRRLRGHTLLLPEQRARRKANFESIAEVLLRVTAFVHDRREHVEHVELRPLALRPDGTVEVREACVRVSDAFERAVNAS
jgi:hypothetical protein